MTSDMFTNYFNTILSDIATFIPYALGIFTTIWGLRLAISFFKRVAR